MNKKKEFYQTLIITLMTKIVNEHGVPTLLKFPIAFIYMKSKTAAAYKNAYYHFFQLLIIEGVKMEK